jgi:chloride channel 2
VNGSVQVSVLHVAEGDDEDLASKRQQHATDLLMEFSGGQDYSATNSLPAPGMQTRPIKSILKKTPSFHFPSQSPEETYDLKKMAMSAKNSPYGTMDSTRMKKAMDVWKALGRAASQLSGMDKGPYGTWTPKRVQLPHERIIDLPPDEQRRWEERELSVQVDFNQVSVDPAPFQLVEKTTLLKVHSLFSLLSLKLAYVTALGRLVGVVALRDVSIHCLLYA